MACPALMYMRTRLTSGAMGPVDVLVGASSDGGSNVGSLYVVRLDLGGRGVKSHVKLSAREGGLGENALLNLETTRGLVS